MTCHGRAGFDAEGHATTFAGFDPTSIGELSGSGDAPVGPINSSPNTTRDTSPSFPTVVSKSDLARFGFPADFVWSIPFCAIDDTADPPETKSHLCAAK